MRFPKKLKRKKNPLTHLRYSIIESSPKNWGKSLTPSLDVPRPKHWRYETTLSQVRCPLFQKLGEAGERVLKKLGINWGTLEKFCLVPQINKKFPN